MKKLAALFLALCMSLTLVACGSSSTPASSGAASGSAAASQSAASGTSVEGKTVAFIPKLTGNAFFEVANTGAQEYAKDWGITIDYMGDATASVSAQVAVINQAIASGVDAICISTVDAAGVSDALNAARDAGIVVCTWDSDANAADRGLMVSQGTPEVLGQMLVDMSVAGLQARGVDPEKDDVTYCWHYSQATVTDQNSWQVAGEKIIAEKYPNWTNVNPDNYYSEQDAEKAITVGEAVLSAYPDIDLVICNDSTALPGQLQAAENMGYNKDKVTITGFATPNAIKEFCNNGTVYNWGLWDCGIQGAMGCYVAAYMAAGNSVKVGDVISIPGIGDCEVLPNDCLSEGAVTADADNGVVLLPEDVIFTAENMNNYDF
jgi:AI-2 transport system substrate-binding protein